jgi:PAS domain S-box-containing protein
MRAAKETSVAYEERGDGSGEPSAWTAEALLDDVREGFIAYDTAWKFRYINRTAEAYLGQLTPSSPRELLGKCIWEAFPSLVGTELDHQYRLAASGDAPLSFELFRASTQRWLRFRASPSARGLSVFFHDITEQKRLERDQAQTLAELQGAEEQLRLTIDNAPIGMALIGLEGQWLRVNQRVVEIVGYSAEELRALTFQELTHPEDLAKDLLLFEAMLRGEISRYELPKRYVHKDGSIVDILLSASILRNDHGEPRLFIAQIQDLREKKRLEAQLTLSDRMASIGTLASGIAHEINNPLAYVMLNLSALAEELRPLVEAAAPRRARALLDLVDDARTGAERVRKIVRGLKTFARAGEDHRVPMAIESAIEVAVNMTSGELRNRARLVKSYGLTPRVVADEARLGQVFINLLVNAAHAIPEGNAVDNEIGITTSTDAEGRAVVEIRDTGVGIPAHLRARIFDPFFTTKEIGKGTGLGLSISHEIIAALGGLIEVSSELGKGTTFRVMLPGCDPS